MKPEAVWNSDRIGAALGTGKGYPSRTRSSRRENLVKQQRSWPNSRRCKRRAWLDGRGRGPGRAAAAASWRLRKLNCKSVTSTLV